MIAKFSVKKPMTVFVAVVLILILGVVSFTEMTPDLLPSINLPYAVVVTTYPGASPEEVETTVTKPVEQSMATLNNIKEVSSTSSENVSLVILEFNDDVDMDSITVDVREKLDQIEGYWDDTVSSPIIMKINPDMLPIVVASVDADDMGVADISKYVEETVQPALEGVDGVASVSASGLLEEQVNVVIRDDQVEKVNDRLKSSISDSLSEAEDALNEAEDKISEGKAELENQTSQLQSGMVQADQALSEARMQILQGEIALENAEKELASKESEALSQAGYQSIDEMEAGLTSSLEQINSLLSQEASIKEGLPQLETGISQIDDGLEQVEAGKMALEEQPDLKAARDGFEAMKAQGIIDDGGNLLIPEDTPGYAETAARAAALKAGVDLYLSKLAELTAAKADLTSQREELASKKTEAEAAVAQIDKIKKEGTADQITSALEGIQALRAGKNQLASTREQLTSAKNTLIAKAQEAGMTKYEAESQLADAKRQLEDGEKELDEQRKTFDSSRESALDAADVTDKLTVDMISQILTAQNFSMPAGYVTEDGIQYLVRVGNKLEDVEELENLVLFDPDVEGMEPVRLSDVADVYKSDNSADIYAKINGNDGVVLSIEKQPTYATADVAEAVQKKFEELENSHDGLHFTMLSNQGDYIHLVVDSVLNNLLYGAILAILILLFFLKDLRPTIIIACSIPISVIFAIVLMYFSGVTLNMISLSGLAVGVGMLVDNSVVVIENIYRLRNKGATAIQAAVSGTVQVAGAITSSTLTTVSVFLPIVFIKGMTRQLFTDMALTITYSLVASLIVAVTLVPAMASGMLKKQKEKSHKWFDFMLKGYEKAVSWCLRHRVVTLLAAVGMLVFSVIASMSRGTSYMPAMDSTQISVSLSMPEGSGTEDTKEMADEVIERIMSVDGVETVGAMMGGGGMMSSMSGGSSSESVSIYAILEEEKTVSSQKIAGMIEEACADLDCEVTANGSSMDISALGGSGITMKIEGQDLDALQEAAKSAAEKLASMDGVTEVDDGIIDPTPELRIVIDKEKAMLQGVTVAQAYMDLQKALRSSSEATELTENSGDYPVIVDDASMENMTTEDIRNYVFTVTGMDGTEKEIALKDIAAVEDAQSLSSINRESQRRYVTVSGQIADGYNVGIVSREVEKEFEDFQLPEGCSLVFAGENETVMEAMGQLIKMLLIAVAFIYLIMVAQFQSLLSPFIVMFTIPLAFTGGFLGLFLTGKEVSVIAMIGFVMLAGIIVNNGIVLVDYINQLRREGTDKRKAIVEAGVTRMRPILMTAVTTILGLLTMAIGVGTGAEMMQPVAIVTIGGLTYATLMTLFVVPVLYDIFNRREMRVIKEEELVVLDD
ncbi:efflux RND transporter permease subunit [Lacrimispora sp. NSJ-141]|uniref:Efflux RND transporter permease subunit n=1 Tax=Lientehia hominis TaxID=2897778 RepID=A0AAP2RKA6_9FIRM|nr:efflux RND transporter permease subunit [Lientehia hominis]MCD2493582.1 efflux RND transporter permease subunit [Lientehia hominis]